MADGTMNHLPCSGPWGPGMGPECLELGFGAGGSVSRSLSVEEGGLTLSRQREGLGGSLGRGGGCGDKGGNKQQTDAVPSGVTERGGCQDLGLGAGARHWDRAGGRWSRGHRGTGSKSAWMPRACPWGAPPHLPALAMVGLLPAPRAAPTWEPQVAVGQLKVTGHGQEGPAPR